MLVRGETVLDAFYTYNVEHLVGQDVCVPPVSRSVSGMHEFFLFDKGYRWRVYLLIH